MVTEEDTEVKKRCTVVVEQRRTNRDTQRKREKHKDTSVNIQYRGKQEGGRERARDYTVTRLPYLETVIYNKK